MIVVYRHLDEIIKYTVIGVSAYVVTGLMFGLIDYTATVAGASVLFMISMYVVVANVESYTLKEKGAFAVFLLSGMIFLKQAFDIFVYGAERNLYLWWAFDILMALFVTLLVLAIKRSVRDNIEI